MKHFDSPHPNSQTEHPGGVQRRRSQPVLVPPPDAHISSKRRGARQIAAELREVMSGFTPTSLLLCAAAMSQGDLEVLLSFRERTGIALPAIGKENHNLLAIANAMQKAKRVDTERQKLTKAKDRHNFGESPVQEPAVPKTARSAPGQSAREATGARSVSNDHRRSQAEGTPAAEESVADSYMEALRQVLNMRR